MNDTIDLEKEIIRENAIALASETMILDDQAKLDAEVEKVLATADAAYRKDREALMAELGFNYSTPEATLIKAERQDFSALPQNRIMSMGAIKAVCLKYGLRFLPTRFYRGALDSGIGPKVEEFKALLGGKVPEVKAGEILREAGSQDSAGKPQFYIAAPSASFALQPVPRDPLLFCRLSIDKFFLIHKWGADLQKKDTAKHDVTSDNWNSHQRKMDDRVYYHM
jgi:hypothetical protein